ncbi:MAG: hypothetical protein Q9162_000929 [Coniocarpon cinnabarinum]
MEHLVWDPDESPRFQCSYYTCNTLKPYNSEGFHDYLERQGHTIDQIVEEYTQPMQPTQNLHYLVLIQNFAFFSYLHQCCSLLGVDFDARDFIATDDNGKQWLSTRRWPQYAQRMLLARARSIIAAYPTKLLDADKLQDVPHSLLARIAKFTHDHEHATQLANQLRSVTDSVRLILKRLTASLQRRRVVLLLTDPEYQLIVTIALLTESMDHIVLELFPPSKYSPRELFAVDQNAMYCAMNVKHWCRNRVAGVASGPSMRLALLEMPSHSSVLHGPDLSDELEAIGADGRDNHPERRALLQKLNNRGSETQVLSCSDSSCLRSIQASMHMKPCHRCDPGHSDCPQLVVDEKELASIYLDGGLPVVALDHSDGKASITVVRREEEQAYCAISHVWYVPFIILTSFEYQWRKLIPRLRFHGLGNSYANSLPLCQLQHISSLVATSTQTEPLFWLDTLCVPVSEEYQAARKEAISHMSNIYKQSSSVLVLDRNLQLVGDDPIEMGFQLLYSEWSRRLWTLQEAILPGPEKLVVAFKEQVLPWNDVCNSESIAKDACEKWLEVRCEEIGLSLTSMEAINSLDMFDKTVLEALVNAFKPKARILGSQRIWNPLERHIRYLLDEMLSPKINGDALSPDTVHQLSKMMNFRTTSKPADEFICIATLLGLDLTSFEALPSAMDDILRRIPVSENIIFMPGPRVSRKGFRWAPASLLAQDPVSFNDGAKPATVSEEGIQIQKGSLLLQGPLNLRPMTNYVFSEKGVPLLTGFYEPEPRDGTIETASIDKAAFILAYDFGQEFTHRTIVPATLVEVLTLPEQGADHQSRFLSNWSLVSVQHAVHHAGNRGLSEHVPVEYRGPERWLVD